MLSHFPPCCLNFTEPRSLTYLFKVKNIRLEFFAPETKELLFHFTLFSTLMLKVQTSVCHMKMTYKLHYDIWIFLILFVSVHTFSFKNWCFKIEIYHLKLSTIIINNFKPYIFLWYVISYLNIPNGICTMN